MILCIKALGVERLAGMHESVMSVFINHRSLKARKTALRMMRLALLLYNGMDHQFSSAIFRESMILLREIVKMRRDENTFAKQASAMFPSTYTNPN